MHFRNGFNSETYFWEFGNILGTQFLNTWERILRRDSETYFGKVIRGSIGVF